MIDLSRPVAELVTEHPECARVLQRHRIDFCCRGRVPLEEACRALGIDPHAVSAELETAMRERRGERALDPRALDTRELVELIVDRHHAYLRRALPFLGTLTTKVVRVHSAHDPRLRELSSLVSALAAALLPHLDHEEQQLFPAVVLGATTPDVLEALSAMEREHDEVGELLHRLRVVTGDYDVPEWACRSYRTLFAELEHLESDVLTHVHLENHVLAARARQALTP